jgi:hypothetical protein
MDDSSKLKGVGDILSGQAVNSAKFIKHPAIKIVADG